jgi:deoxyribodipyrimidine photo-lyase
LAQETHGVPLVRLRRLNRYDVRADGEWVLYWMIATRRTTENYALQYAAGEASRLGRPLFILEALRCGYRFASDRLHRFVLDGMVEKVRALARTRVTYYPYVEPGPGAGSGLLEALAARSCLVITDDYPCFFLPRMVSAAAAKVDARMVAADSNGLLPLRAADRAYTSAYHLRRFLQSQLPVHLESPPLESPLDGRSLEVLGDVPGTILRRWPAASSDQMEADDFLSTLPIDHAIPAVDYAGGAGAANAVLDDFIEHRLDRYAEDRNEPSKPGASGLSPWLHWGHLSTHRVLRRIAEREDWAPEDVSRSSSGKKSGWWNMSEAAESFLDEIVTWRELGYNMSTHRDDYADYESLPDWAQATLADHGADPRPARYTLEEFEAAATHDPLWNAAQVQLRVEGRIHNYLRMLWGKKILEWTESPRQAAEFMIHLNDRWAVDGRDPNSYSGIFWCLGRYDRPWPERAVYGTVRSMTSDSTRRKYDVGPYVQRWSGATTVR